MSLKSILRTASILVASIVQTQAVDDILVADFEAANYGAWEVTGEAFGPGPAKGALPGQMAVAGYKGERLVNSFFHGDDSTGTLTSPPIKLERDYLVFRIGGGGFAEKTCLQLRVGNTVVRAATGPNTQPGGSEDLEEEAWDIREWKGKMATIEVLDLAKGGWGHINVDHIVQTDTKPATANVGKRERVFTVEKNRLVIPIRNGVKPTEILLEVDGKVVRRYDAELALRPGEVDWHAYLTIGEYGGRPAKVSAARATEEGFGLIHQADVAPGAETWYSEAFRPQFHFSQDVGWNNDPNGMVYLDGEWHLFFQHNPVGWKWGNMTWGHAVSRDLVHWEQLADTFFPKAMTRGDAFSGGATVDLKNTAGWKTGSNDVLVAFLTDTGAGESVAYSNDNGRTFQWYEGNPVVKHRGRDPKVIWYAYGSEDTPLNEAATGLGGHWVMAVYDEHEQHKQNIAFYTSTDLKQWQEQSHLPGYFECPELFKLAVDGDGKAARWVVMAADARYAIGAFDGRRFTPDHEGKHQVHWGKYYASQTFDHAPDGRRIQIGWAQIDMPGMPFNQAFSFPHELTLRSTDEGIRMYAEPVKELEKLHGTKHSLSAHALTPGAPARLPVAGDLFDVRASFEIGNARLVGLDIGGNRIVYDAARGQLGEASLKPVQGRVTIRALVDRPMLEICGNDGRAVITAPREKRGEVQVIEAFADGGAATLVSLEVFELQSIWKGNAPGRLRK